MKKEMNISDVRIIYTKDELKYQEVLDDFINAKRIIIILLLYKLQLFITAFSGCRYK